MTIEYKRQTGRTTRMIAAAKEKAGQGRSVIIVAAHKMMVTDIRKKLEGVQGILVEHVKNVTDIDWNSFRLTGARANNILFIDHDVFELRFKNLLLAWTQYDVPPGVRVAIDHGFPIDPNVTGVMQQVLKDREGSIPQHLISPGFTADSVAGAIQQVIESRVNGIPQRIPEDRIDPGFAEIDSSNIPGISIDTAREDTSLGKEARQILEGSLDPKSIGPYKCPGEMITALARSNDTNIPSNIGFLGNHGPADVGYRG